MWVAERMHKEWPAWYVVSKVERGIEQIIYEFVCQLEPREASEEFSYYREILSKDDKFMKVVKEIYENRHKCFERGYKSL
jgi:hypothetical protein